MSDLVKITFDFPKLLEEFERQKPALLRFVAAQLQTQRAMIFDQEGAYNGRSRWKSLMFRKGQILSRSGGRGLRGSIAPMNNGVEPGNGANTILRISGENVTIGTNLIYANLQDKGGVVRAKPGKALKIPVDPSAIAPDRKAGVKKLKNNGAVRIDGEWCIFRKKVTIPARNFTEFNKQDEAEVTTALKNRIAEIINGA